MAPTERHKQEQGWLGFDEALPAAPRRQGAGRSRRKSGKAEGDRPTDGADPLNAELFRSLIMAASEGLCGIDLKGTCTFCNPAAAAMLGIADAGDLVGKSLHDLVHGGVAEESRCKAGCRQILRGMRQGQGVHLESEVFRRRDGSTFTAECRSHPAFRDGAVVGAVVGFSDITEKKRALEAFRDSEVWFRAVIDNSAAAINVKSVDGRYLLVNRAFQDYYRIDAEQARGKTASDIFPSHLARIYAEMDRAVVETEATREFETQIPFPDGTTHTLLVTKFPMINDRGKVSGIGTIGTDITTRKRTEDALRQSEERLRDAVDSLQEGFGLFDRDDRLVVVNEFYKKLNPSAAEAVEKGLTFEELLRANISRGILAEAVGREEEFLAERLRKHRNPGDPIIRRFSDGRFFLLKETRTPEGGTALTVVEISEQKQTERILREREEQLRAAIENSPAAICFQDTGGRFLLFNREFEKRFGVSLDDARGKRPEDVFPEEVARSLGTNDDIVLDTELPCEYEVEFADQYNVVRTGFTNKFPIFGPQGEVVGIGSICADMTDHKQMEEKLRHAQKLEAVGQLTGGVAHDFNNILAVILTNLEFLEEDLADQAAHRETISEAIRAVHRGAKLTERLLAFSRKQPLNPKIIDLVSVLSDMVELLRRTLGETITVQTQFPGDLRQVFVDRNQFENAVLNLAVNARDAMKRGGKLEIICSNKKIIRRAGGRINEMPSGQYVCVEIRDTGEGMSPEVMERAFEPFFTTKKTGEGSGLGLSMVYGFANQSGGAVTISSVLGEGTSVKLFLPAVPADGSAPVVDPETENDLAATGLPRGNETILVVEDDADVGSSARRTLTSLGYRVFCAADAIDALDILKRTPRIDLLFSDVIMPGGVDGRELAEEARQLLPAMKIVLTSGYAAGRLNRVDLEKADIGFVPKPYTRRTLAEIVRQVLDR